MTGLVGKIGTVGLVGVVAATAFQKANTEGAEKRKNNLSTALGLGALGGLAYAGKEFVKKNPQVVEKAGLKATSFMQKVVNLASKNATKILEKVNNTKVGNKVLTSISKAGSVLKGKLANSSLWGKISNKITNFIGKFNGMSAAGKGKFGLITAGVALLAAVGLNLVKNHYKKEGAIEQKYDTLRADYEQMLATNPIMNGQTGEPISFDDYCKVAQTYVK